MIYKCIIKKRLIICKEQIILEDNYGSYINKNLLGVKIR